jgi:hypothetical protein
MSRMRSVLMLSDWVGARFLRLFLTCETPRENEGKAVAE